MQVPSLYFDGVRLGGEEPCGMKNLSLGYCTRAGYVISYACFLQMAPDSEETTQRKNKGNT